MQSSKEPKNNTTSLTGDLASMQTLGEVERRLLPLLRDNFDASLVVFYLFGQGPLEVLHLGGWSQLHDELMNFHQGSGSDWLRRASLEGPILRDRCALNEDEFKGSPFAAVLQGASAGHSRGLVISAKGEALGMITLFRSSRQSAFTAKHDDLLLTYAAPLADLMTRLIYERSIPEYQVVPLKMLDHLEEGVAVFDEDLRLVFANRSGWNHLRRVSRTKNHWRALPSPLQRQLRLVRELDRGPEQWSQRHNFAPLVLKDDNDVEIRFRTYPSKSETTRFYSVITSTVRTLPAASVDQVARRMGLTPREREVCGMLVEGKRNRDIAKAFGITEHTVKIHVRRVLGKFRVRSRSEIPGAVLKALSHWEAEGGDIHAQQADRDMRRIDGSSPDEEAPRKKRRGRRRKV